MTFHIFTLLPPFYCLSYSPPFVCDVFNIQVLEDRQYPYKVIPVVYASSFLFAEEMWACVCVTVHFHFLALLACAENLRTASFGQTVVLHTCRNVFMESTVYNP